jgi:maltose-binding protein MalE
MPHIPVYAELCDIIGTNISEVISGQRQPQEAMNRAYLDMFRVLRRYGFLK